MEHTGSNRPPADMRWIHRLLLRRYRIAPDFVLNASPLRPPSPPGKGVADDLAGRMKQLKATAFDSAAGRVDYRRLTGSPAYQEYRRCADQLQVFDLASLDDTAERLVFWINLYNALVIDAVIQFGVKRTVTEIPGFFWRAAYQVGPYRFSAYDIEYGVLRANGAHPAIPGLHFGRRDPRCRFSLPALDPRVHFALVCAARSCPPIAVYSPGSVEKELDLAARSFINNGGVEVDAAAGVVLLSKIFQWYAPDFGARPFALGPKGPLLAYVAGYLANGADRRFVRKGNPAIRFMPYDWRLNLAV